MAVVTSNMFGLLPEEDCEEEEVPKVTSVTKTLPRETPKTAAKQANAIPAEDPVTRAPQDNSRRGARNNRGGRGGRPAREGKRDFDRRSGSANRKDTGDKKEQHGPGNWGKAPSTDSPSEAADAEASEEAAAEAAEKEEEENYKTLNEYLETRESLNLSAPKARKAGEGADGSKWKDTEVVLKGEEAEFFTGKERSKRIRQKERKVVESIDFVPKSFYEEQQSMRGRGRGGGAGGRGGRRSENSSFQADDSAFPALGGK